MAAMIVSPSMIRVTVAFVVTPTGASGGFGVGPGAPVNPATPAVRARPGRGRCRGGISPWAAESTAEATVPPRPDASAPMTAMPRTAAMPTGR